MANTLKELAATVKLVPQEGLEKALTELKTYIDKQDIDTAAEVSEDAVKEILEEQTATDEDIDELFPDLPPIEQ